MSIQITESEILSALATAKSGPEDARTVQEMVAATGVPERRVRQALRALQAEGRLQSHRVHRPDLAGRVQVVPAYTIAPRPKRKR